MVNPGVFRGLRKEFLKGEKAAYAAGATGGYAADALANIQRRYFKRFPIDLSLDQDPTLESLASVDDDVADEEPIPPCKDTSTQEEYDTALQSFEERGRMVALRKAQLKRWFAYQYMKDQNIDSRESGLDSPYRPLLKRLSGVSSRKPKQNTGTNVWRRGCREEIEEEAKKRLAAKDGANKKKDLASIREAVVKERFSALSAEEKQLWKDLAKAEHEEALAIWEKETREPPKTDPLSRQQCIQALPSFVQPILEGISAATGWKCTLIAGGPEPAHNGRLNMIGVHCGTTKGDIKMNFGRAEKVRWQSHVVDVYGDFLKKCYTPEDCRLSALPEEEGFQPLTQLELTNVNIDTIGSRPATRHATPAVPSVSNGIARPAAPAPSLNEDINSPSAPPAESPIIREEENTTSQEPPSTPPQNDRDRSGSSQDVEQECPPSVRPASPSAGPSGAPNAHERSPPPSRHVSPSCSCHTPSPPPSRAASPSACLSPPRLQSPPAESGTPGCSTTQLRGSESPPSPGLSAPLSPAKRGPNDLDLDADRTSPDRGTSPRNLRPTSKRRRLTRSNNSAPSAPSPSTCDDKDNGSGRQRSSKRPRKSNTAFTDAVSSPMPITTKSIPGWFTKSLAMFKSLELGETWEALLDKWSAFEAGQSFQGGTLPSTRRPLVIAMWIGRRRSVTWRPNASELKNIESDFNAWWMLLQPEWRVIDGKIDKSLLEGDWDCLKFAGVNGFQSVIAALFFWSTALPKGDSAANARWLVAVEDCREVLEQLQSN